MKLLYWYPNRPILIPPDPENPLQPKPDYINGLEQSGKYVGELKWNGDNVLIYTSGPEFWNRHKARHRYAPPPEVLQELAEAFPSDSIINAELVHYKTKDIKDLLVVHSVLAWKGKPLSGKSWGYARELLEGCSYGKHVVLSETFTKGFWERFQQADGKVIEGIVLKDPAGLIRLSTSKLADVSWMCKIRKPCAKYNF